MKATESNVGQLMAGNKHVFVIPVYQRNYDWEESHCRLLLNDIIKAGQDEKITSHFIGSIVYVHDDIYSAPSLRDLTIIDGQQRLTTLTLLYAALYWHALNRGQTNVADEIYETYLINKFAPETEKLKLKPTENNRKALQCVLEGRTNDFSRHSRIIENYKYFEKRINDESFKCIQKGIDKLIYVDIALERGRDNPQRIFESLNSTGLDLSQADLIRNYILMELERKEQERIFTTYWEVIEKNARDNHLNESRVSDFIRDFLTLQDKKIPNKDKVYVTFKKKYPTATIEELESVLQDMLSLSKCYGKLINPSLEKDTSISKHIHNVKRISINVAYPFLMQVYADYENAKIDRKTFIAVLELVQSYVWRRFLIGLPTNGLNKMFMVLYGMVDGSNYLYSIQKALLTRPKNLRFPTNTDVASTLRERNLYAIESKNTKYLFERLEHHNNQEPVLIDGLTVEHIFPQNPDPAWKNEVPPEEYEYIQENLLHTIGNLTLSGNNGSLGNKTFREKRDMNKRDKNEEEKEQGYRFSRLWLNRDLKEKETWRRADIEERTKRLMERILEVWKFPEIMIDTVADCIEVGIFEADDPTGKQLEYLILFEEKYEVRSFADAYVRVLKQLFERHPDVFYTESIKEKVRFVLKPPPKSSSNSRIQYNELSDSYFIKTTLSNLEKTDTLKFVLTELGYEDELIIKYA